MAERRLGESVLPAVMAVLSLAIAGCASTKDPDEVAVSVSAANYSKLSDEDL